MKKKVGEQKMSIKTNRTVGFYKETVPEQIQGFFSKDDFYASLRFVISQLSLEGYELSSLCKRIAYLTFTSGATKATIKKELNISNDDLDTALSTIKHVLVSYYAKNVTPYPLRVIILKQKDLRNKPLLKKVYHGVIDNNFTVSKFLKDMCNIIQGKQPKSSCIDTSIYVGSKKPTRVSRYFCETLSTLVKLIQDEGSSFVEYVIHEDKIKASTIRKDADRVAKYMSNN